MRGSMRGGVAVAALWLAGCAAAPSLSALQLTCGTRAEFGQDAMSVYPAYLDAYVAYRHGGLTRERYCAFQSSIARQHEETAGAAARGEWADFINAARAKALSWRAAVDPSLRGW